MDVLREFDIEFIKLKEGEHHFEYQITEPFFKAFNSSLTGQDIVLNLLFIKTNSMFTLVFDLKGTIELDCDRCLTRIGLPIKSKHTVLVKITEHPKENEDDLMYLSPHDYKLNIAQHVFDFVYLSLPIKKTCADVGLVCDPAVTDKITSYIDVDTIPNDQPERDTDDEDEDE